MRTALALQAERHGAFDVTLDLEDGAPVRGAARAQPAGAAGRSAAARSSDTSGHCSAATCR
jgi:hypothetical protein